MANPELYDETDFVAAPGAGIPDMEQLREEFAVGDFSSTPVTFVGLSADIEPTTANVKAFFSGAPDATDIAAAAAIVTAHDGTGPTENSQIRVISGTSYTVLPTDDGCRLYFTAATAVTVTVDTGLGKNFSALWRQVGAGLVTFVEGTGTLHHRQDQFASAGVKAIGSLVMSNVVDTVDLAGDTA